MPNMAKKMQRDAARRHAEAPVLEVAQVEHRVRDPQLPRHEPAEDDDGDAEPASSALGAGPAVARGLDDGVDERDQAGDRQHGADRVEPALLRVAARWGRGPRRRRAATTMIGTLTKNTEPHQKCSSRKPLAIGPMAAPAPAMPAQMAMALVRSVRREDVGQDRQRGRHDEGGAETHDGPAGDDRARRCWTNAASNEPARNTSRPTCSAPLRPKRSPSAPAVKRNPANTRE